MPTVCGIAGIWERSGKPVDPAALERMSAILRHRGPDGRGVHLDSEIGLVNRRLAILDPTPAGDQPMSLPERGLWLTYNGEVHNYVELRRELEAGGARFRTQTDTEVVLQAYATWGRDCFERFNGMWSLAIWDARRRELVLSRDRFGIKPLCYSIRGERICFASEPKAILAAYPEERAPDETEIGRFLSGWPPDMGDATFFAGIRNLSPATCMIVARDGLHRHGTWSFEPGSETPREDAEERFRELLRDSVRIRTRSDVPLGLCLSGGLDSGSIAALLEIPDGRPMHAFSLRYDGWPQDESRYASIAAAARPGCFVLHWVTPRADDLLETMRKIVWHHDAPTQIRGRLPHWFVAEEASRHVKVVLDGEGSDEQLAGYEQLVFPYLLDRLLRRPPAPARAGLPRELARLGAIQSRNRLYFLAGGLVRHVQREIGVRPYLLRRPQRRSLAAVAPEPLERPYRSALNNGLWYELRRRLPEILHDVDALTMAFSVEARTPFLDHRLVELCFSLPYSDKIAGGWTKSLLRRSLEGIVPREILERRLKVGFPAPTSEWLLRDSWQDVRALLLDRRTLERGVFDRRRLERALRAFARSAGHGRYQGGGRLWRWVTLELWFRDFVDVVPTAARPASQEHGRRPARG
ncbi:MAG: asparagine synthase (glutamine-hydrolyzing) [Gaiellaceae bacterium]